MCEKVAFPAERSTLQPGPRQGAAAASPAGRSGSKGAPARLARSLGPAAASSTLRPPPPPGGHVKSKALEA